MPNPTPALSFSLTYAQAAAALLFVDPDDIRDQLNAVHVELGAGGDAVAVATDGAALAVLRIRCIDLGNGGGAVTIPRELLDSAVRAMKSRKAWRASSLAVNVYAADEFGPSADKRRTVHVMTVAGEFNAPEIGISFPDWRRVIPATANGQPAQYGGELLARFERAAQLLAGPQACPVCASNGDDAPALVEITGDAFGVLMPRRIRNREAATVKRPQWLDVQSATH